MTIASDLFRTVTVKINDISQQLPYIVVNQADNNGKIIRFLPLDHGQKVTGFTGARLYYLPRSDDEYGDYVTGVESDGAWDFTIPVGILSVGRVECNLAFIDGDGETYSRNVVFLVEPAVSGVFDPEDGQQTRLDKIIGTVQDAADTAIESVNQTASDAVESIGKAEESIGESVTAARAFADAAANSEKQAAASASAAQTSERNGADSATQASHSATAAAQSASEAYYAVDGFGLTVGSVTTGEPGTDATVDITKDGAKYTANFTIPRGEKGDQGVGGTENVLIGTASGTIAAADDSYSAPRQIRVHGETIENFWKFNDGKTAKPEKLVVHTNNFFPNISGKPQNGITLTQDANGVYHMDGVSTINGRILWAVVANVPSGDYGFKHSASRSNIDGYINTIGSSQTTVRSSSAAGQKGSMTDFGSGFRFYIRCDGLKQGVEYHDTVQIVLASGTDIPPDFPKNESSEVALPSDLNLADGDTLVIDSDGSTQITHSSGEPTPSTPVTLPAIPAPTFAIYTKGGLTRPTVDVDYERNINIVINKLEQTIAVQAATMKVNQLTD